MATRILHLSDLHLNTKKDDHDQSVVIDALCDDLKIQTEKAAFDIVVFTGDLVGKGAYAGDYKAKLRINFVNKVLSATKLTKESMIFCPGNHDVELSVRDKIYEAGLQSIIIDKKSINDFIADHETNVQAFKALEKYNDFANEFSQSICVKRTPLYSSFIFEADNGKRIGFSALNSAWRATGAPNDRDCGALIVGERQVELAATFLKKCDFKIALLHHPLNWISPKEITPVQRAIARNFDLLMHGHVHEGDGHSLVSPNNNLIISGAGCLYQSRDYFDGYSIVTLDWGKNKFIQEGREYYGSRNCFDKSLRLADDGKFETDLIFSQENNFILPENSVARISESINQQLISSAISEIAPEDIGDVFVEPKLSRKPAEEIDGDTLINKKIDFLSTADIENSTENFFIWGKSESGKSTLLNYLAIKATRATALTGVVAFCIDGRLLNSVNAAVTAMIAFCDGAFKRSEIERALNFGKAVVYIDNIYLDVSSIQYQAISKLLALYPKAKYIFTASETDRLTLVEQKLPVLGVAITEVFLLPFTRKQVRSLIKNWFGDESDESSQILEGVLQLTSRLQLPRSPFLMSMVLWLSEKKIAFSPVNYATLIENFIDGLLEKLHDTNFRSEVYTFRVKQHFLSELAAKISENSYCSMSRLQLEEFAVHYFQVRPQPNAKALELVDHFFRRGILLQIGDEIRFKLECFREYFVAKRMLDNHSYLQNCVNPDNLAKFHKELDYYSALKQDDADLLKLSVQRMVELYDLTGLGIESNDYARLSAHEDSIMSAMRGSVHELISAKPSNADRESMMDDIDEHMVIGNGKPVNQSGEAKLENKGNVTVVKYDDRYANYLRHVTFCATIIRNSELVGDKELLSSAFEINMEHWAKNCIFALAQFDVIKEDLSIENASDEENENIQTFVRNAIPIAFIAMLKEALGTAKLAEVIKKFFLDRDTAELPALLAVLLYADLTLPNYIVELESFVDRNLLPASDNLIFSKLLMIYFLRRLPHGEQVKIENLLARESRTYVTGNTKLPKQNGEFVQRLRNKVRLLKTVSPDSIQDR
ncbi:metallophosphoesterase [Duganella levis]|uniref:Calcineurin-like phosphoesterase domain-containing protein n=1 Tax=Duganella levis TaxID=2692169 RepID=A0ABW9W825_9BURK|nr:metallophosphoesterase [Duganella levis]MYN30094.1 hypothetical protein [Duganella levis]